MLNNTEGAMLMS